MSEEVGEKKKTSNLQGCLAIIILVVVFGVVGKMCSSSSDSSSSSSSSSTTSQRTCDYCGKKFSKGSGYSNVGGMMKSGEVDGFPTYCSGKCFKDSR